MICSWCRAHRAELVDVDACDELRAELLDECTCAAPSTPDAGAIDRAVAIMRAQHDAMPIALLECGHTGKVAPWDPTHGVCFTCERWTGKRVAIARSAAAALSRAA